MEQNFNRRIETDLDLNGPHVVISSHPSDATVNDGATQTFTVSASASFPGNDNPDDEGTLTYQWYEYDDGDGFATKLTNQTEGVTFSGTTTATLTLTGISSPDQNGLQYYCIVDYTPADRYPHEEKGAGHPIGGSVTSNSATLTVNPYLVIISQPSSIDREYNVDGNITVTAALSDTTYSNDIGYQWYRNDSPISDQTYTTTRIERGTVTRIIETDNTITTRHNYSFNQTFSGTGENFSRSIPNTATNVKISIAGGGGGKGGTDYPWNGGGDGGNGRQGEFTLSRAANTTLTFGSGLKGSDGNHGAGNGARGAGGNGHGDGGDGGAAGGSGASGGGGGGGGGSYVAQDGTSIIVAGGGGGGGGESYNAGPETSSVGIGYDYVRRLLGVHDGGKTIAYGDSHGNDWNATLKITSGDAKFLSEHKIGGSGSTNLYYSWADNPRRAGRSNTFIRFGTGEVIEHTYNRAGSASVTVNLGSGSGNKDAGGWDSKSSTFHGDGGHDGHPCECSDGAGGGGGGGGAVNTAGAGGGSGGAGGCDNSKGGFNGAGGKSFYRSDYTSGSPSNGSHSGNGYVSLSYDWYEDQTETITTYETIEEEIETSIPQNITFSGTQGSTLNVKADYETVENLYCVVSSPQSSNSPLTTNTVQFSSYSNIANKILNLEKVNWDDGTSTALLSSMDLNNGEVVLNYDPGTGTDGTIIFTSFYTTQNISVEIDLYGGKGSDWTAFPGWDGNNSGGQDGRPGLGGYGRIRGTLFANTEYIIAGMFGSIDCPYFYRKDQFLACVGQGGGAGFSGNGGPGGGLDLPGGAAIGGGGSENGGNGGWRSGATSEQPNITGVYGSRYALVQSYPYKILNQRLYDACQRNGDSWYFDDQRTGGELKRYSRDINNNVNLGTRKIIMRDGTFINNTASIDRGFMDIEYSFIQTAGGRGSARGGSSGTNATSFGGNGFNGGDGGYNSGGGGGGSGMLVDPLYSGDLNGQGRWYEEETSSGTWDGNSKVIIRPIDPLS